MHGWPYSSTSTAITSEAAFATLSHSHQAKRFVTAGGFGGGFGFTALVIASALHLFHTSLFGFPTVGSNPGGCVAAIVSPFSGQFFTFVVDPGCNVPLKQEQSPQVSWFVTHFSVLFFLMKSESLTYAAQKWEPFQLFSSTASLAAI